MERKGFLPISILPIIWIGGILLPHRSLYVQFLLPGAASGPQFPCLVLRSGERCQQAPVTQGMLGNLLAKCISSQDWLGGSAAAVDRRSGAPSTSQWAPSSDSAGSRLSELRKNSQQQEMASQDQVGGTPGHVAIPPPHLQR